MDKLDIIVLAGQSNAAGSGRGEVTHPYVRDERILMMTDDSNPREEKDGDDRQDGNEEYNAFLDKFEPLITSTFNEYNTSPTCDIVNIPFACCTSYGCSRLWLNIILLISGQYVSNVTFVSIFVPSILSTEPVIEL